MANGKWQMVNGETMIELLLPKSKQPDIIEPPRRIELQSTVYKTAALPLS